MQTHTTESISTNSHSISQSRSTDMKSPQTILKPILQPVLKAPKYRTLTQNFTFPMKLKKLNAADLETDMDNYQKLKSRIVLDSIKLGGVGSLFAWSIGGIDVGFAYTFGCLYGAAYLYLLGKKVDVIGYGVSTSQASQEIGRKDEILANARLLMPLLLVLTLVARHNIIDSFLYPPLLSSSSVSSLSSSLLQGEELIKSTSSSSSNGRGILHLLEKTEFLAAIGGFLTHRLTLFYTEIIGQMTIVDWLR